MLIGYRLMARVLNSLGVPVEKGWPASGEVTIKGAGSYPFGGTRVS